MIARPSRRFSGVLVLIAVMGLLTTMTAPAVTAKPKACRKGFVRNKTKRCVRRKTTTKATTATTVKRTSATTAKPAASKGTIKLGLLDTSVTTGGAKTLQEATKIAQAWMSEVRSEGGINGYKIELVVKDYLNDTSRAIQAVKDLDKDGVLALAGSNISSNQITAVLPYMNDKKLPSVGGQTFFIESEQDPMVFPISTTQSAVRYGIVAAARDSGAKSFFNGYCTEVAACQQGVPDYRYAADREGLKFAAVSASAVSPDYTALCVQAKNSGADFVQSTGLNFANLVRDCVRQNYHPVFGTGGAVTKASVDVAKGERVYGAQYELPTFYKGPEMQALRQAIAHTDLSDPAVEPASLTVTAWAGLEMARAVINRLTAPNPTRQDFLNALYTIKGENLGGLTQPIDYTVQRPGTGLHTGNDCWLEYTVKDETLVLIDKNGQTVTHPTWICGTGRSYPSKPAGS